MAFLDETGLARFLTDLKAWIAGSTSNLLHRTGNEEVAGDKTFTGTHKIQTANGSWIRKATGLERGAVPPSANDINYLMWREALTDKDDKICAYTRVLVNAAGRSLFQLVAEKWISENDTSHAAVFSVGFKPGTIADGVQTAAGDAFAMCPSTPDAGDGTDVVTRDWIPKDTRIVHTTGSESIAGNKTFTGALRLGSSSSSGIVCSADSTNNAMEVDVYGAASFNDGAVLRVFGKSNQYNPGYFILRAATSSTVAKQLAGRPDGTLTWDGQAIQTSSDERLKTPLSAVPDAVLDAWGDVNWGQFQYLDAIDCKGETARLHLGLIAQRVKAAFEARGLDACAYGILCHEVRPAVDEETVVVDAEAFTDEDGVEHPAVTHIETRHEDAVDLWMVRYSEAQAMETIYQRRRADRLEARIAALEAATNG